MLHVPSSVFSSRCYPSRPPLPFRAQAFRTSLWRKRTSLPARCTCCTRTTVYLHPHDRTHQSAPALHQYTTTIWVPLVSTAFAIYNTSSRQTILAFFSAVLCSRYNSPVCRQHGHREGLAGGLSAIGRRLRPTGSERAASSVRAQARSINVIAVPAADS